MVLPGLEFKKRRSKKSERLLILTLCFFFLISLFRFLFQKFIVLYHPRRLANPYLVVVRAVHVAIIILLVQVLANR